LVFFFWARGTPVLLELSFAGNLVIPLMSLYGTKWRERGYGLRRRGSEVSDDVRSPEPAIPELEISSASEERKELEEDGKGAGAPLARAEAEEERERKFHLIIEKLKCGIFERKTKEIMIMKMITMIMKMITMIMIMMHDICRRDSSCSTVLLIRLD
jgi:hypothetical protein